MRADVERYPWLGVELRHLATLDAIERERSFRGAARKLGYAQSAVSQQIATLERVVDARLVERRPARDGLILTPAGRRLVEHGREALIRLHAARTDLDRVGGCVHVGLGAGVASAVLPRLVPMLGEHLADVGVRFYEPADEDELPALVSRGDLDLAIGVPPPDHAALEVRRLIADPWVLIAAADSRLALGEGTCTADRLARLQVVAPLPSRASNRVLDVLRSSGVLPRVATRLPAGPAMQAVAAGGEAVALMPRLAVNERDPAVRVVGLDLPLPTRPIVVWWNGLRRATSAIERVAATVDEVMRARAREDDLLLVA